MCTHIISQKKNFVEWICDNGIAEIGKKKNLLQLVCGNAIVEIGGKNFVAMSLLKMGGKKKIVVGAFSDTTKVGVESSCKWMYFLFIANGLQIFFF